MGKIIVAILMVCMCAFMFAGCGDESDANGGTGGAENNDAASVEVEDGVFVVGDVVLRFISAELSTDFQGYDAIVITYEFTNNSDDAQNFIFATGRQLFQGGIELEAGIMVEGVDAGQQMLDIRGGATITVSTGHLLRNLEEDIELEIDAAFALRRNPQRMTIRMADLR